MLNKDNYYSKEMNKKYFSYSQFKNFLECPAKAMAIINDDYIIESSDSMLVGSYIDSYLDEDLENFKLENPQIFNSRNGELKSSFKTADTLIERIKRDEEFYKLLKGKRQQILKCKIAGVEFKCKIDSLLPDKIVDGKVLKDCKDIYIDGEYRPFWYANRYDIQAIIYKTAVKQTFGLDLPFILAVITKEKEPDLRVFEFSEETLQNALNDIINNIEKFNNIKNNKVEPAKCENCDWCKRIKQIEKDKYEII